ncbi:ammonium transporter [Thalassospira alkalitolerans]|uniref:Ammonium transporter n=1 Tax=Thalassospira alkalitolerans TaxID=1293890 RepID=A0A1Y2LF98_9PROT|nr:ammonium transporter [Thalassospira alkalitolerans]OSQ49970.1 ammonium transporter [Thalassospira alkalitolerans]|tara:strand:+ start:39498 stop:40826 length:1329 start_codon:yes stop_codon:yes gene_type:complete
MNIPMKKTGLAALVGVAAVAISSPAFAQDAGVSAEVQYIFNTFSFLFSGALVMWMAAGFAMLESGLVRTKNVSTILFKNIALFAVAGIMYYLIGYNLMYMDVSGWIGSISLWSADDAAALGGDFSGGYSATSDWFFQMVFVATAASIVSGTVAERIKLWPFMIFVVVLTGVLYPITGAWTWGGGWLSEMGFSDFAGSTIVHSVGGWAALTGAIILGARKGKYGADGSVHPMPGSNLPLATLGTFILWLGWFGFNGGSQLAMGTGADVIAIANIYGNTTMAAAGGVVAAAILTQLLYKKVDLTMALNGALAGLVSITAGPDTPTIGSAIIIGAIGGILVVVAVPLLDKLKIDDVVGAVSVHLVCGIWGTLAVPFTNDGASFGVQLTGVVAMGAFTIVASAIVWLILKFTVGIRLSEEDEAMGSDAAELGLEAYPEFGKGSQRF